MEQLTFFGANGKRIKDENFGVTIALTDTPKTKQVRFIFSEEATKNIAPNNEVFVYAIAGTRLYFRESEAKVGFKMCRNKENIIPNRYSAIAFNKAQELFKFAKEHLGAYELKFDKSNYLWYIETQPQFMGQNGREV